MSQGRLGTGPVVRWCLALVVELKTVCLKGYGEPLKALKLEKTDLNHAPERLLQVGGSGFWETVPGRDQTEEAWLGLWQWLGR